MTKYESSSDLNFKRNCHCVYKEDDDNKQIKAKVVKWLGTIRKIRGPGDGIYRKASKTFPLYLDSKILSLYKCQFLCLCNECNFIFLNISWGLSESNLCKIPLPIIRVK